MSQSAFRSAVCCLLAILFPAQMMLGGETASAMLYTNGVAWLNGSEVPKFAAVFVGDALQTQANSSASLQSSGSSVMVLADTLATYQGSAVELEHGAVRVTTARAMVTRAGDVTVKPAANSWTEFQVSDIDGRVQIAVNKGDVTVQDDKGTTTTVTQGQQTTLDDTTNAEKKKKKRRRLAGALPAGGGGIMNSTTAIVTGLGIVTGIGVWVWIRSEGPVSPSCPSDPCE